MLGFSFDVEKFKLELVDQLLQYNFNDVISSQCEHALSKSLGDDAVVTSASGLLADVVDNLTKIQYSVKVYKTPNAFKQSSTEYSDWIIERRIAGVPNPDDNPKQVFSDVLIDLIVHEKKSKEKYGMKQTNVLLLGYFIKDNYIYFQVNETNYDNDISSCTFDEKLFSSRSSNFNLFKSNRSAVYGKVNDVEVYKWVHPNNQATTRCFKKKYKLKGTPRLYFKVKIDKGHVRLSDEKLKTYLS